MWTNPSETTVSSQIGSAKIVYKSLMHPMTLFKLNLCRDIEKNPGPEFYELMLDTTSQVFVCSLLISLTCLVSKRDQLQCVSSNCIRCMFIARKLWSTDRYGSCLRTCLGLFETTLQLICYNVWVIYLHWMQLVW